MEKDPLYPRDEAEKKFVEICRKEYKWEVSTRLVGNALWIYQPYRENILEWKASRFPQSNTCLSAHIQGNFANRSFNLEYQIIPLLKPQEDKGYTFEIVSKISENFQYLLNVIYRVYFNAEEQPEFYVIVIADINNGIEMERIIYNDDLKMMLSGAMPMEESYKRILNDTRGGRQIINSTGGAHLDYRPIEFSRFLSDQIVQRIFLKFREADSSVCALPEEEILRIASYVMRTYGFREYSKFILRNLSSGTETEIYRWALEESK